MKFNIYTSRQEPREPVAFIDGDGDLFIIDRVSRSAVCITEDNSVLPYEIGEYDAELERARHVFYAGDEVTITF